MTWLWPLRALLMVSILCVVVYDYKDAELWAAAAAVVALVALEVAHAYQLRRADRMLEIWHRRWKEEHDNFQAWIRNELDRRI